MRSDTHEKYPRGDAALIAAINSGAPVPTNERQAGELTQRYGVWYLGKVSFGGAAGWCSESNGDPITFDSERAADKSMHEWGFINGTHEVRPYPAPAPTPPAAPGEWSYIGSDLVYEGKVLATCFSEPVAYRIVRELNRADAMERALRKCMSLIAPLEATNERLEVFQAAQAALRKQPLPPRVAGGRAGRTTNHSDPWRSDRVGQRERTPRNARKWDGMPRTA
jgi:hypothetical protein